MSSKEQVVMPNEMRKEFKEDEKFIIIKNEKQLILKSIKDFNENLKEDLIFAKRTEKAWKRYAKTGFIEMNSSDFIKILKKLQYNH